MAKKIAQLIEILNFFRSSVLRTSRPLLFSVPPPRNSKNPATRRSPQNSRTRRRPTRGPWWTLCSESSRSPTVKSWAICVIWSRRRLLHFPFSRATWTLPTLSSFSAITAPTSSARTLCAGRRCRMEHSDGTTMLTIRLGSPWTSSDKILNFLGQHRIRRLLVRGFWHWRWICRRVISNFFFPLPKSSSPSSNLFSVPYGPVVSS